MRLRTKLFLILVVLSITPLIATGILIRQNIESRSVALAQDTRAAVEQIVEVARTRFVNQYAATFDRDRVIVESTVQGLASTMEEIALSEQINPDALPDPGRIYTDSDFDNPETAPPNLTKDDRQYIQNESGPNTLIPISRTFPVFVPGQGNKADVDRDIRRLAALTQELVAGSRLPSHQPWLLSVYAALDSTGTHISFPGKGGYPDDYDPRNRPWYQAAIESETGMRWIGPIIDAPTGQVRMTCAAAAVKPDGTVLGVAAADILMLDLLDEIDLPADMMGRVEIMLATVDEQGVLIHAKADYADQGGQSRAPIRLDYLISESPEHTETLLREMRTGDSGSIEFDMEGEPWILSFQRLINQDSFVIVAITRETVDAVANNVQSEVQGVFTDTLRSNAAIGATFLVIAIVVAYFGAGSVTRPITKLTNTATALAEGDLDATADIHTGDEIQTLAETFNAMVPKLRDRLAVRESLMLAMEVQQNLLPEQPPEIPGIDVAARSIYCDETGGDYYDFFELESLEPHKHAIVVGDVTGHGIAAALLMTTARALLRSRASDSDQIAEILSRVNTNLAADARPGHFMTLYYLLLDTAKARASWVSAGHDAALVYHPETDTFSEYSGRDIPLGIEKEWTFHEAAADLPKEGGVVVIGTDGIWEARDESGDMFGKDRLKETIKRAASRSADDIANAVLEDVTTFRRGCPQTDDITLVILKIQPARS